MLGIPRHVVSTILGTLVVGFLRGTLVVGFLRGGRTKIGPNLFHTRVQPHRRVSTTCPGVVAPRAAARNPHLPHRTPASASGRHRIYVGAAQGWCERLRQDRVRRVRISTSCSPGSRTSISLARADLDPASWICNRYPPPPAIPPHESAHPPVLPCGRPLPRRVDDECRGFIKALFQCKRSQLDQRTRFRGNKGY